MAMNRYLDETLVRRRVANEGHRAVVGGMWDVIGPLQRDFLIGQGLAPSHRVLDVGCGALRAGAPLAAWLEPGRYYGIDISETLIEAGHAQEIVAAGLGDRLPRANLHVTDDFEAPFGVTFDFGLATSLFTHLSLEYFTRCLDRLAPVFAPGGRFYATVFEGPVDAPASWPGGVTSHPDRDPFHFTPDALEAATPEAWAFARYGDWGHPRGQRMLRLIRRG